MTLSQAQTDLNKAQTKMDLYSIAGSLNNRPEHILQDKVTFMGFMDFGEAVDHVQRMIETSLNLTK